MMDCLEAAVSELREQNGALLMQLQRYHRRFGDLPLRDDDEATAIGHGHGHGHGHGPAVVSKGVGGGYGAGGSVSSHGGSTGSSSSSSLAGAAAWTATTSKVERGRIGRWLAGWLSPWHAGGRLRFCQGGPGPRRGLWGEGRDETLEASGMRQWSDESGGGRQRKSRGLLSPPSKPKRRAFGEADKVRGGGEAGGRHNGRGTPPAFPRHPFAFFYE